MLEFRLLDINDKEIFENYAHCFGYHNIEASFANKYIWSTAMDSKIAIDEYAMYILLKYAGEIFMLPPFLKRCDISLCSSMEKIEEYMQKTFGSFLIKGVTKEIMARIEKDCPGKYKFIEDRINYEYVYLAEDLAKLEGKKFHVKRTHINKVIQNHTFEYRRYRESDYEDCIALQQKWIKSKDDMSDGYEELEVIKNALLNLERLNLVCGVLIVDGKLCAYSIGERFENDMVIIHIEKADADIDGAFPLINREFVRNEWSDVRYINREEDMGIEGLRKAKLSYCPVFFLEKYDCVKA